MTEGKSSAYKKYLSQLASDPIRASAFAIIIAFILWTLPVLHITAIWPHPTFTPNWLHCDANGLATDADGKKLANPPPDLARMCAGEPALERAESMTKWKSRAFVITILLAWPVTLYLVGRLIWRMSFDRSQQQKPKPIVWKVQRFTAKNVHVYTSTTVSGGGGSIFTSATGHVSGSINPVRSTVARHQQIQLLGSTGQEKMITLDSDCLSVGVGQLIAVVFDDIGGSIVAYINDTTGQWTSLDHANRGGFWHYLLFACSIPVYFYFSMPIALFFIATGLLLMYVEHVIARDGDTRALIKREMLNRITLSKLTAISACPDNDGIYTIDSSTPAVQAAV